MAQARKSPASRRSKTSSAHGSVRLRPLGAAERAPSIVPEKSDPGHASGREVRLLMRADHVDEREMLKMFAAIRVQLLGNAQENADAKGASSPAGEYRPGAGIILLNARGEVFIDCRADVQHDAWQIRKAASMKGKLLSRRQYGN